jgi:hypothetical protein
MDGFQPQINLELPEHLHRSLVAYQQQQAHDSPASAILSILGQFLQSESQLPAYATQAQLQQLEAQVSDLSKFVTQMSQAIALRASSAGTEETNSHHTTVYAARSTTFSSAIAIGEEMEDEPDEVLYDFLE